MKKINSINQVLQEYFEHNKSATKILAKDMMPYLILAGIFKNDIKNGSPIKNLLNRLKKNNKLHLIPFAILIKIKTYSNWYFIKTAYSVPIEVVKIKNASLKSTTSSQKLIQQLKENCNQILGSKGKKNFVFSTNPSHKVDLYYPKINLAIGYVEKKWEHKPTSKLNNIITNQSDNNRKILEEYLIKNGIRWLVVELCFLDKNASENSKIEQIESIKNQLRSVVLI